MKKMLLRIIGPTIFLFVIYFYVDLGQLINIILRLKLHFFVLSVLLVPILVFIRSTRWRKILKKTNISYSIWKCFRIYFVELVTIMVVPAIGTFVKAVYPKRDGHGLLYPVLSVICDKYFDYLLPVILGLTSFLIIILKIKLELSLIILFLMACMIFIPAKKSIIIFSSHIIPNHLRESLLEKGLDIKERLFEIERILDLKTYILSLFGFVVYYFVIYFLCKGLSIDLKFSEVVLLESITTVITLIPISFFGVGTRDVGLLAAFELLGHTPEQAIALSLTLLLLRIVIVFMGSVFWFMDPPQLTELKQDK